MSDTIATIEIDRTIEGIEITAQSEEIEDVFRSLSGGNTTTIDCYDYNQTLSVYDVTETGNTRDMGIVAPADCALYAPRNGGANLTFLRAAGLGDGITMQLPELHSREALKNFCREARNAVGEIYREFMEELNFELEINKEN